MPPSSAPPWPLARDYVEALQNPRTCFSDPALQETVPAIDRLSMPTVSSGQFAYVFKLNKVTGSESHAVRCFRGFVGERERRYKAIDDHLDHHSLAALARFEYEPSGLRVNGGLYPLLVMEWIDGPTLDVYIEQVLGKKDVLMHLADQWIKLVGQLKSADIAHGDLQHGNVIVQGGTLRLVDFDGMFVPSMNGWSAIELGHRHYQHPLRDGFFFDRRLDNFSAIVIYLSLIALANNSSLWTEFHDENLLFKKDDYIKPSQSKLFAKINSIGGQCRILAEVLQKACAAPPPSCPVLSDFVSAKSKLPAWMSAPVGAVVVTKTREVSVAQAVQPGPVAPVPNSPVPSRQATQSTPMVFPSQTSSSPIKPSVSLAQVFGRGLVTAFGLFIVSLFISWIWIPVFGAFYVAFGGASTDKEAFATLADIMCCLLIGMSVAYKKVKNSSRGQSKPQYKATLPYQAKPSPTVSRVPSNTVGSLVVGSLVRKIYHRPSCEWAYKISARNRINFSSAGAALARGYRRCKVCAP